MCLYDGSIVFVADRASLLLQNIYLVSIAASNQAKNRFYDQDLPRLQDDLQSLWTLTDRQLVGHLKGTAALLVGQAEKVASKHRQMEQESASVDTVNDHRLFVEFNRRRFDKPADLGFEPCSSFFQTSEMVTEDSAKVFLQNMLLRKEKTIADQTPLAAAKAKEIEGLQRLQAAYLDKPSLGNPEDITDNLLESVRANIVLESQLSILEAEVEAIVEAIGEDRGNAKPHLFKPHTFAIPAKCGLCEGNIFPKGLSCKCTFTVHSKCEGKVPADCRANTAQRQPTTSRRSNGGSSSRASVDGRASSALSRQDTTASTTSSAPSAGRRAAPPPNRGSKPDSRRSSALPQAKCLYDYEATSEQELSITEGEQLHLLAGDDDGSGWVKAINSNGQNGLVPAAYIEIASSGPPSRPVSRVPALTPQQGTNRFVRALYDYAAQEDNELTLKTGEQVELSNVGFDFGSGWCEGVQNGRKGVFPANYVEEV